MSNFPKISIITPSFNQGDFIKKTIDSVLSQNYPNLEYIIMDGGSADGTISILKSYGKKIIWRSEKDRGQAEAINKGLKLSNGEIITYLNSDDLLEKGALFKVGEFFKNNPDKLWVFGKCRIINEKEKEVRKLITAYKNFFLKRYSYNTLLILNYISQPAVFWKREILETVGYFKEDEFYELDYEYWLRIGKKYQPGYIDDYLSSFRVHQKAKSGSSFFLHYWQELVVASRFSKNPLILNLHFFNFLAIILVYSFLKLFKR
ncbi:MAG: glycosyltransferase [Candidatus Omnitrophica bacterium]|nr:glycosyltransferase [Candidatus Omnitrophota bacterium]